MANPATEQSDEQAPVTSRDKRKSRKGIGVRLASVMLRIIWWFLGVDTPELPED